MKILSKSFSNEAPPQTDEVLAIANLYSIFNPVFRASFIRFLETGVRERSDCQKLTQIFFRGAKKWIVAGAVLCVASSAFGDSLFSAELSRSIIADKKAHAVGDIITIIVQESNSTKKESNTQTSRASDISAKIQSFFFSPNASTLLTKKGRRGGARQLPALEMNSENKFDGGGKINNSESIVTRFAVRVVDVLPNDNLIVEGVRQTSFSGEAQTIVLRGTVRTYDIGANNTVFSYNLADVSIKMESSGAVSNAQRKGWFTKAWDVLAPF